MINSITPPSGFPANSWEKYKIFLAGSIEMGVAEEWQQRVMKDLEEFGEHTLFLNPRRLDWDSTWTQERSDPNFYEQVNWELDMLDEADLVLFYFDPTTKSPITLMELGLHVNTDKNMLICCASGFWRKGNIDIVAERAGREVFVDYSTWLEEIKRIISDHT